MQPTAGDSDSNSSSSGVSSSSSDSDSGAVGVSGAASGPDPAEGGLLADVLLLNKLSGVIHAAVPCGEETPARRCVRLGGAPLESRVRLPPDPGPRELPGGADRALGC